MVQFEIPSFDRSNDLGLNSVSALFSLLLGDSNKILEIIPDFYSRFRIIDRLGRNASARLNKHCFSVSIYNPI